VLKCRFETEGLVSTVSKIMAGSSVKYRYRTFQCHHALKYIFGQGDVYEITIDISDQLACERLNEN